MAAALVACRGSDHGTIPVAVTGPTPTAAAPQAPVITSLTASSDRVEAGQPLQLAAAVTDGGFQPTQVSLAWSASPNNGTFSGTGTQQAWTAPVAPAQTPDTYTLTLSATAKYKSAGQAEQYSPQSSVQVHYNDSDREITALSLQFLKDFTTFSVSPEQCVRNFSDACQGKADELSDITNNRRLFHILGGTYSIQSITYDATKTYAHITAPCTFYDIPNATGVPETVQGICLLTATYQNWQWYLCISNFQGIATTPGIPSLMGAALEHHQ